MCAVKRSEAIEMMWWRAGMETTWHAAVDEPTNTAGGGRMMAR
jgi:hypothetical protein